MLQQGQIVRYGQELYRVDHCNESRARIVPLSKKHVQFIEGGEKIAAFDAERGGVNISANSELEIIEDIELARDQIELEQTERELAEAKAEIAAAAKAGAEHVAFKAAGKTAPVATSSAASATSAKSKPPMTMAARAAKPARTTSAAGGGWMRTAVSANFKNGTLAELVMNYIVSNPGKTTAEIVAAVPAEGNVASAVSRFMQAGLIVKS